MNDNIFGYSWDDIQAMQQKRYVAPRIGSLPPVQEPSIEADRAMLAEHGSIEALEAAGLLGVVDRLRRAGA